MTPSQKKTAKTLKKPLINSQKRLQKSPKNPHNKPARKIKSYLVP
jgi:hypothetical protein